MFEHGDQHEDVDGQVDDTRQAITAHDADGDRPGGIPLETFWARLDPLDA